MLRTIRCLLLGHNVIKDRCRPAACARCGRTITDSRTKD